MPARPGRVIARTSAVAGSCVLICVAAYFGLGLACQAWSERPELAWLALVAVIGLIVLIAQQRGSFLQQHADEDDDDDDGGLRAPGPPAPELPPADWAEFDA